MDSIKRLPKILCVIFTAVIFITAVSLFAKPTDAADTVASISVTPVQSSLDKSDMRTVYRYDSNKEKYVTHSYYDVYDYDNIKLTVNYGSTVKTYTGSEITRLTATLGKPLVISDGQADKAWGNGNHTVTYKLGNAEATATFKVVDTKIASLTVTPMYTINAIYNVDGSYRTFADSTGKISQRFVYDLGGYDYNVKIIYKSGVIVNCTAADLKQETGYEAVFSQGDGTLSIGAKKGYCTIGGVTASFSFNIISNPIKSVQLYMTEGADKLYASSDGYYDKKSDGSAYFRFIYDRTKIRAKVAFASGGTADYPIGELCAKLHSELYIEDLQSITPWKVGEVTLPATISGIKTSLTLGISGAASVSGLRAENASDTSVKIAWTGGYCTGYIIEKYDGKDWIRTAELDGKATSYTFTGLEECTEYHFAIRSYYEGVAGSEYADWAYITVETAMPVVRGFRTATRTSDFLMLSWSKNPTADGYIVEQYKNEKWTRIAKTSSLNITVKSLSAGTSYRFRIKTYKGSKSGGYTYLSADTLPGEMDNFVRSGRTGSTVTLSWSKNTSATGYVIRQYKNNKWTEIAVIRDNSVTSYKVSGLAASTAHRFSICAYKTTDNATSYSGYKYVTVNTLPGNVGGFTCSGKATNAIALKWDKNTSASGYIIEQYTNGKWVRLTKLTSADKVSCRITKLSAGISYRFRIKAYKLYGKKALYSGYTTVSVVTNPQKTSGLKYTKRTGSTVTLNWSKNTTASGYEVQVYKNGKWTRAAKLTSYSKTSCTVSGLSASTVTKFRVRAYKTVDGLTSYGAFSTISVRTLPANVSSFKCSESTNSTARLTWAKNSSATGYILEQYSNGKWVRIVKYTSNSNTSCKIIKLASNKEYRFRIRAYKTVGEKVLYSRYTNLSVYTTPTKVSSFKSGTITTGSVKLSWKKNGTAAGYIIQQYKNGKWVRIKKLTKNTTTSYTVTGLPAGTTCKFRILAYNFVGKKAVYSAYTSLTAATKPADVAAFRCSKRTNSSLTLGWNKNSSASGYIIEQYKNGEWVRIKRLAKNTTTSYTVTGLPAGSTCKFRIQAFNFAGKKAIYSGYTSLATVTKPTDVAAFRCSKQTSSSLTLGWNKNGSASGYIIEQYKNGKWVRIAKITKNSSVSYTVGNLKKNTAYSFRIKAYRTINKSAVYSGYKTIKATTTK